MTETTTALTQLIQSHGLWLLLPLSILEGPIVTVIAAWLARLGLMPLGMVYLVCVLGDVIGDLILYWVGRRGLRIVPPKWRVRMGIRRARLNRLARHFDQSGGRTLVTAKLTHSLGFAALAAAGAAKMPLVPFIGYNLAATLPKTALFVVIGYALGQAHAMIDTWIARASFAVLALAAVALTVWLWRRRSRA